MAFSLSLITQQSEADNLVKMAQRDKRTIVNRRESLLIRTETGAEDTAQLAADLNSAKAQLTACIANLAVLPEGAAKEAETTKKMELELRVRRLSLSGTTRGAEAILEQEYDADLMDKQVAGIDAFIVALEAHKATLV
ncbi:MAG: hypothetical protein V4722_01200 [Bacteroidota bacterium]